MIKTRLIHCETFQRADDKTIAVLVIVEYFVLPEDGIDSFERDVEYRLIHETYRRGRSLESSIDIRSRKWRVIAEELYFRQMTYMKNHSYAKVDFASDMTGLTTLVERRLVKLVGTFNNVDPRIAIAFPECESYIQPIIEMPFVPIEKQEDEKALCVNNTGMVDRFDIGEFYSFRLSDDSRVLVVKDRHGIEVECMTSRFRV